MSGKATRFLTAVSETRFTTVDDEPLPIPDTWTDYRHEAEVEAVVVHNLAVRVRDVVVYIPDFRTGVDDLVAIRALSQLEGRITPSLSTTGTVAWDVCPDRGLKSGSSRRRTRLTVAVPTSILTLLASQYRHGQSWSVANVVQITMR